MASAHATIQCALEPKADLRSDLAIIEVPSLIVHGTSDKICLFDLAKFKHDDTKGWLVPPENAGHGFYYEEKEKLNTELLNFISWN